MQTVAKKKPKNLKRFANRLRSLRELAAITQVTAAAVAGVHIQTYMRWERGETEPTFSELCALAAVFGKKTDDFVPEDE